MQSLSDIIKLDPRRWADYVRTATGGAPALAVQARSGVHQSTISRWYDDDEPTAPSARAVIAIARAYRLSVVEALMQAGYLDENDTKRRRPLALRDVPTSELMREIERRTSEAVA